MNIATISVGEEHCQYIGQIYQENYARLRHYFLTQLGNATEADACIRETIRHFFFFMEDRCWETDVQYAPVYLMRIAGGVLCSKKMAGEMARRKSETGDHEGESLFGKLADMVLRPIKERLEYKRLFQRVEGSSRQVSVRHLQRASAASV